MAMALVISEGISGGKKSTFGFAFNMEKIFEYYVRKLFHEFEDRKTEPREGRIKLCSENRYELNEENQLIKINSGEKIYKCLLKPDIVYKNRDEFKIIVDCKWKQLIQQNNIQSEDIKQLFIYQMAYNKRKVKNCWLFLIYPSFENNDKQTYISRFFISKKYPKLWAFSFPVFKFNDTDGSEPHASDDEEQRCWENIKTKLEAIISFDDEEHRCWDNIKTKLQAIISKDSFTSVK